MVTNIHPTAIIDSEAKIGEGTTIGPFCHIDKNVEIGKCCSLDSHVRIKGKVTLGSNTYIGSFSSIGSMPAIYGENSLDGKVSIGKNCHIQSNVTICSGHYEVTSIGNDVLIMSSTHIGHDSKIANGVVIAALTCLAGHCKIDSNAFISGHVAIHQHCRIGRLAFVTGSLAVADDIPPFSTSSGLRRSKVSTLNVTGLKRFGVTKQDILSLHKALWLIYNKTTGKIQYSNLPKIRSLFKNNSYVMELADFFDVCKHKRPLSLALSINNDKF